MKKVSERFKVKVREVTQHSGRRGEREREREREAREAERKEGREDEI